MPRAEPLQIHECVLDRLVGADGLDHPHDIRKILAGFLYPRGEAQGVGQGDAPTRSDVYYTFRRTSAMHI